jgi:hypothetical protein
MGAQLRDSHDHTKRAVRGTARQDAGALSQRFLAEADRVLKTGKRQIAYERYDYTAEAAAEALSLRRGVLTIWPRAGQPHADEVYTHSASASWFRARDPSDQRRERDRGRVERAFS